LLDLPGLLGFELACAAALFFKHAPLRDERARKLETGAALVAPFAAYFCSQALALSGITTVLVLGVFMGKYAKRNTTPETAAALASAYGALAQTFEAFVFLYMGLAFSLVTDASDVDVGFALVAVVAVTVARAVHVALVLALWNASRPPPKRVNFAGGLVVFLAGLRGPMAFALSAAAARADPRNGAVIQTSTVILIAVTLVVLSAVTPSAVRALGVDVQGAGTGHGRSSGTRAADARSRSCGDRVFAALARFDEVHVEPCLCVSDVLHVSSETSESPGGPGGPPLEGRAPVESSRLESRLDSRVEDSEEGVVLQEPLEGR